MLQLDNLVHHLGRCGVSAISSVIYKCCDLISRGKTSDLRSACYSKVLLEIMVPNI